jgi:branched-chain amino acid transport system permease protein
VLHLFKDLPDIGGFRTGKHWQMWMGLFIVALIIFAPKGILGLVNRFIGGKDASASSGKESGHG